MPDGGTRPLPGWPRALRPELAAAYLGLSPSAFYAGPGRDVEPVQLTPRIKAWLREDLDAWLDKRRLTAPPSAEENPWHQ